MTPDDLRAKALAAQAEGDAAWRCDVLSVLGEAYRRAASPDVILALLDERDRLREMLRDLHELVLSDCPAMLDEDSGASASDVDLDLLIRAALAEGERDAQS